MNLPIVYAEDLVFMAESYRQAIDKGWLDPAWKNMTDCGEPPYFDRWPTALTITTDESASLQTCRENDHDWVDTSYCGPDSGDMSMYCKRCGYSFHHTLY